jgi:hypothetical protein
VSSVCLQLCREEISSPTFAPNRRKFGRYFKGLFKTGNVAVRILPGQPSSPGLRENAPDSSRKARQQRAFAIQYPVSVLPISRNEARIRGKSLANTANIPVFGRRRPETGSITHCVVIAAVVWAG